MEFFKFLKALSIFTGTIIGVGIFSLPYIASQAGFFVVLGYFIFMTVVAVFLNVFYGRVVAGTQGHKYLPSLASQYLGKRWKIISLITLFLGTIGSLLAYLIVGGKFLNLFLSPTFGGNELIWMLIFFAFGSLLIFRGSKSLAKIELFLLATFFFILAFFFVKAVPVFDLNNFLTIDLKNFMLPYGVILFSLWGATFIPELKEMVSSNTKMLNRVIVTGTILSSVIYLFFIITILGVSGNNTSEEAMAGFISATGSNVLKVGFLFAIINIFDSFICVGIVLKKILWKDFGLKRFFAWAITCFLPLSLFFFGGREYIFIIGIIGAFLIGIEGSIIVFVYRNFLKLTGKKVNPFIYSLCLVFLLGVIFETIYLITK